MLIILILAISVLSFLFYRLGQYSTAVQNDITAAHREGYNQAVSEVYWKSVEGYHVGSMGSAKDEYCTIGYYPDRPKQTAFLTDVQSVWDIDPMTDTHDSYPMVLSHSYMEELVMESYRKYEDGLRFAAQQQINSWKDCEF